jgi:DNA repair exonuclease SbcCD nuclease subunit
MKICCIGDQHWRANLPYGSAFSDGRRNEWNEVIKTIHKEAEDCDVIVLGGDNLNSRNNSSLVLRDFVEFLKRFGNKQIHILCGNHESSVSSTALDFLQKMDHPNWHVYTEPTLVKIDGLTLAFTPYLQKDSTYLRDLLHSKTVDVLFAHNAYKSPRNMIMQESEYLLGEETLGCKKIFFSHIHNEEKVSDTIQGTGSILTNAVGEHERAIWKYDTTTKETERIPLPVRGIYKIMWDEKDIWDIPTHSIVKCIVTTKGTDLTLVEETLKRFDAHMIVEDYNEAREKHHFETGALDLSLDSLLKVYAEQKNIDYTKLMSGVNLLNS